MKIPIIYGSTCLGWFKLIHPLLGCSTSELCSVPLLVFLSSLGFNSYLKSWPDYWVSAVFFHAPPLGTGRVHRTINKLDSVVYLLILLGVLQLRRINRYIMLFNFFCTLKLVFRFAKFYDAKKFWIVNDNSKVKPFCVWIIVKYLSYFRAKKFRISIKQSLCENLKEF